MRSAVCVLHLVIRDLLQIQMGAVDHLHAGVAIVSAAEGAPVFGVGRERVGLLSAALRRKASVTEAELLGQRHVPSTRLVTFTSAAVPRPEAALSVMPVTNRAAVV